MPVYVYECQTCGNRFEDFRKIEERKEPEMKPCRTCGAMTVRLIITANFELLAPDQLGRVKPPEEWRTFLSNLKKKNPGSDFTTY